MLKLKNNLGNAWKIAQIVVLFNGVQIISVKSDSAHTRHRFAFRGFDTDRQTVCDRKYLGFYTIRTKNATDAVFNSKGFSTAHCQPVTQISCKFQ